MCLSCFLPPSPPSAELADEAKLLCFCCRSCCEREREGDKWANEMVKLTLMSSFWAYWLRLQLAIDHTSCCHTLPHLHVNIYTSFKPSEDYINVGTFTYTQTRTHRHALPQPFLIKLKCSPAKSRASHNETRHLTGRRPQNVARSQAGNNIMCYFHRIMRNEVHSE